MKTYWFNFYSLKQIFLLISWGFMQVNNIQPARENDCYFILRAVTFVYLKKFFNLFNLWKISFPKRKKNLFPTFTIHSTQFRSREQEGSNVIKQMCHSCLWAEKNIPLRVITGEHKPGFIRGMIDSLEEAGGMGGLGARFSKWTAKTCTISQQGDWIPTTGSGQHHWGHSTICTGQSQGSATSQFDVLH